MMVIFLQKAKFECPSLKRLFFCLKDYYSNFGEEPNYHQLSLKATNSNNYDFAVCLCLVHKNSVLGLFISLIKTDGINSINNTEKYELNSNSFL